MPKRQDNRPILLELTIPALETLLHSPDTSSSKKTAIEEILKHRLETQRNNSNSVQLPSKPSSRQNLQADMEEILRDPNIPEEDRKFIRRVSMKCDAQRSKLSVQLPSFNQLDRNRANFLLLSKKFSTQSSLSETRATASVKHVGTKIPLSLGSSATTTTVMTDQQPSSQLQEDYKYKKERATHIQLVDYISKTQINLRTQIEILELQLPQLSQSRQQSLTQNEQSCLSKPLQDAKEYLQKNQQQTEFFSVFANHIVKVENQLQQRIQRLQQHIDQSKQPIQIGQIKNTAPHATLSFLRSTTTTSTAINKVQNSQLQPQLKKPMQPTREQNINYREKIQQYEAFSTFAKHILKNENHLQLQIQQLQSQTQKAPGTQVFSSSLKASVLGKRKDSDECDDAVIGLKGLTL